MARPCSVFGMLAVLHFVACGQPVVPSECDPRSCQGCCNAAGRCEPGDEADACGSNAAVCTMCGGQQACVDRRCVASPAGGGMAGSGMAGGGVAGGDAGGTPGGGTAGGASGGTSGGLAGGAAGGGTSGGATAGGVAGGTSGGATAGGAVAGGTAGGVAGGTSGGATAGGAAAGGTAGGSAFADGGAPQWILDTGLGAAQLGVLVNDADPISVLVADAYVQARAIPSRNVVHLSFDAGAATTISAGIFTPLKAQADAIAADAGLQAWVITWTRPYRVDCMSIGTAFAAGFDAGFCSTPCAATTPLRTFDDEGQPDAGRSAHRPFSSWGVRPTMMLATNTNDAGVALAVIARGLAADDTFPRGNGWFFRTTDGARSVRWSEFQFNTLPQWTPDGGLDLFYVDSSASGPQSLVDAGTVLFYFQGLASVPNISTNTYLPGAVADHLTSFGGQVPTSGQMSVLRWLEAGATASYGTVVEPCNFTQKFPNTTVLLSHYYRGEPIIEAYWKSVQMPGEGLFVGEPLARPWGGAESSFDAPTRTLRLVTTLMKPGLRYAVDAAPGATGPWTRVQSGLFVSRYQRATVSVPNATQPFYRLVRE